METVEAKISLVEKSLKNIRGYLWKKRYRIKIKKIK